MTILPGVNPGVIQGTGPQVSWNTYNSATDTSAYTFSSAVLGNPDPTRFIALAIAANAANSRTLNTVTINGVSATIATQYSNGGNSRNGFAAIAHAEVPKGATGDIVLTFNTTMTHCSIIVASATRLLKNALFDSDPDDNNDGHTSMTLDIPAGGFALGSGTLVSGSSATWTGLTEIAEYSGAGGDPSTLAALGIQKAAQSSFAITITGGASPSRYAVASFW